MISQAIRDQICEQLADGKSLRKAAQAAGVAASSILRECEDDKDFAEQYAAARARGYAWLADEIIQISDDSSGDLTETEEGFRANPEFVARSKLRVDSRKWMLSKMLPKVYGDKIEHEHKGGVTVTLQSGDEAL